MALKELTHVSGADLGGGGGGGGADVVVIFVNVSMGHSFPRLLGYMSRLGMGFLPIGGGGSAAVVNWRL